MRGWVCVSYKNSNALKLIYVHYQQKCWFFEILIGRKSCNLISSNWWPNQSLYSFDEKKKTLWPLFMDGVQLPEG